MYFLWGKKREVVFLVHQKGEKSSGHWGITTTEINKKNWITISYYLISQEVSKQRVSLHKMFAAVTVAVEQVEDVAKFFILIFWCTCQCISAEISLPCSSGGFPLPKY